MEDTTKPRDWVHDEVTALRDKVRQLEPMRQRMLQLEIEVEGLKDQVKNLLNEDMQPASIDQGELDLED